MPPHFEPNPAHYPKLRLTLERWWNGRTAFRSSPGWGVRILFLVLLLLLALTVLPYLIPLGGPEMVEPETLADSNGQFVEVNGERLYVVHEASEGEAVLLIHGFGGSTVTWRDTMGALAEAGFDVYAVDLAGFGLSDKGLERDYRHEAQAARVTGVMDRLGIEQAHIVGHSMGGNVAAWLALQYPERVNKLVLVDAAIANGDSMAVPDVVFDLPFVRRWAQVVLRQVMAERGDDLIRDAAYDDAAITEALLDDYRRALHTPEWDTGLIGIVRDGDQNALPAPISTIQAPTLLIWGAEDTWVSAGNGRRLHELIPDSDYVELAGVGHLPMHEKPDVFNAAVSEFLK